MPIDWDQFDSDVKDAIHSSADATDAKLASKISSVTSLTDDEVRQMFPEPADVQKLINLVKIVKSADDKNQKINRIVSNAEDFGGVILSLMGKFL